jgi:hypothetical protein
MLVHHAIATIEEKVHKLKLKEDKTPTTLGIMNYAHSLSHSTRFVCVCRLDVCYRADVSDNYTDNTATYFSQGMLFCSSYSEMG